MVSRLSENGWAHGSYSFQVSQVLRNLQGSGTGSMPLTAVCCDHFIPSQMFSGRIACKLVQSHTLRARMAVFDLDEHDGGQCGQLAGDRKSCLPWTGRHRGKLTIVCRRVS